MKQVLSAKEFEKPYAKYFNVPMKPVPEEITAFLDKGPIDPSLALPIENRNDMLKPGHLDSEMGYCIMPDGTGFIAMNTPMPGVTSEMINWWFAWHGLEGLRYKIWDPDDHYDIYVREEDLEHRLDMSLNTRQRNWGTTDIVNEDIGTGALPLGISFMSPEDFGYNMDEFRAPNVLTAINANCKLVEPNIPIVCFSHVAREIPGGLELRSRFWLGWNVVDKKPVQVSNQVPLELVAGLARHCPKEYSNLAALLPKVYAENVNVTDRIEDFRR